MGINAIYTIVVYAYVNKISAHVHICLYMHMIRNLGMCNHLHIHIYGLFIYMYMYTYMCTHIYTYTYTYVSPLSGTRRAPNLCWTAGVPKHTGLGWFEDWRQPFGSHSHRLHHRATKQANKA